MTRKIIQIAASQCHDPENEANIDHTLYALSDDGAVFCIDPLSNRGKWQELPPLPQPQQWAGERGEQ